MSYIYNADIYCDDCGKDIRRHLREEAKKNNQKLETETSDEYPQSDIGWSTEADSPQHCGSHGDCLNALELSDGTKVGCFLENDLTTDGEGYVKEQHRDSPSEITEMWMTFYGLSNTGDNL